MSYESQIQSTIIKWLETLRPECECHKNVVANKVGVPDITVCYRGRYIAFEIKKPGGTTSPAQDEVIRRVRAAGGCAYSVNNLTTVKGIMAMFSRRR